MAYVGVSPETPRIGKQFTLSFTTDTPQSSVALLPYLNTENRVVDNGDCAAVGDADWLALELSLIHI